VAWRPWILVAVVIAILSWARSFSQLANGLAVLVGTALLLWISEMRQRPGVRYLLVAVGLGALAAKCWMGNHCTAWDVAYFLGCSVLYCVLALADFLATRLKERRRSKDPWDPHEPSNSPQAPNAPPGNPAQGPPNPARPKETKGPA
jgi:hypothetical protein